MFANLSLARESQKASLDLKSGEIDLPYNERRTIEENHILQYITKGLLQMNMHWPAGSGRIPAGSHFTIDGSNERNLIRLLAEMWAGLKKQTRGIRDPENSNIKKPLSPPGQKGQGEKMEILILVRSGVLIPVRAGVERHHFCLGSGTEAGWKQRRNTFVLEVEPNTVIWILLIY